MHYLLFKLNLTILFTRQLLWNYKLFGQMTGIKVVFISVYYNHSVKTRILSSIDKYQICHHSVW